MAIACLAAEAEHAADKLERRGYALIDGSAGDRTAAVAAFDALQVDTGKPQRVEPDHPLAAMLLAQPAVRDLLSDAVGRDVRPVRVIAVDHRTSAASFQPWRQVQGAADSVLILRWHLDLVGPADGGLRVLPGSHLKGRLSPEALAALARGIPAIELPVSAGTVLAMRPLLVHGARRRTTCGHRRILQVELAR